MHRVVPLLVALGIGALACGTTSSEVGPTPDGAEGPVDDGGLPDAACTDACATGTAGCAPCDAAPTPCSRSDANEACPPDVAAGSPFVFAGPFPSWLDVKASFGAKGDGVADDTVPIQKALSQAATMPHAGAVYLPAGTYRITKSLRAQYQHVVLYGEAPETTILTWDGPSGQDMIVANGVSWSVWGRLTFDGKAKAGGGLHFAWDAKGPGEYSTQGVSVSDSVFRNLQKGIVAGATPPGEMDSDVGIVRTRFESCSVAGLSTESWNALDYWVFDSTFLGNARGLTNRFGAGNFNVRNSYFSKQTIADVDIGKNAIFLSLRGNTSIGSKKFLLIDAPYDAFSATVQNNRIFDTTDDAAIDAHYLGDLILLDNAISGRPGAKGPAVWLHGEASTVEFLSLGNRYGIPSAERVEGPTVRAWQHGNEVDPSPSPATAKALPETPPHATDLVLDLPAGASTDELQAALDKASLDESKHPVIHLSAGEYIVTRPLIVPPRVHVTVTGDGWATVVWGKDLKGPVFLLRGPSHAVIQDMKINASMSSDDDVITSAEGIVVENADQPGARVFGEVVTFLHNRGTDVLSDRLARAHVDIHGLFVQREGDFAVQAVGAKDASDSSAGRVAIFGGTSTAWRNPQGSMFKVTDGGRLVVEDVWYEANEGPTVVRLGPPDSGSLTINAAQWSQYSGTGQSTPGPLLDIDRFQGRVTILGAFFALPDANSARFPVVRGESAQTRFLGTGLNAVEGGGKTPYLVRSGSSGRVSCFSNKLDTQSATGNIPIDDSGDPADIPFIEDMLGDVRGVLPRPFVKAKNDITNVALQRVTIQYATNGVHVLPSSLP